MSPTTGTGDTTFAVQAWVRLGTPKPLRGLEFELKETGNPCAIETVPFFSWESRIVTNDESTMTSFPRVDPAVRSVALLDILLANHQNQIEKDLLATRTRYELATTGDRTRPALDRSRKQPMRPVLAKRFDKLSEIVTHRQAPREDYKKRSRINRRMLYPKTTCNKKRSVSKTDQCFRPIPRYF